MPPALPGRSHGKSPLGSPFQRLSELESAVAADRGAQPRRVRVQHGSVQSCTNRGQDAVAVRTRAAVVPRKPEGTGPRVGSGNRQGSLDPGFLRIRFRRRRRRTVPDGRHTLLFLLLRRFGQKECCRGRGRDRGDRAEDGPRAVVDNQVLRSQRLHDLGQGRPAVPGRICPRTVGP